MTRLRILADDLTGALDCAAAFGAGVPVHLGAPAWPDPPGIDIVATATRDVAPSALPSALQGCLAWLRGAGLAVKKVDSLLRGNSFDEIDWLARQGGWGLAMVPAFPAQGRHSRDGRQWLLRADAAPQPVADMAAALRARGWTVHTGSTPPAHAPGTAWLPTLESDAALDPVAHHAIGPDGRAWLWCGSAGLAHALQRALDWQAPAQPPAPPAGGRLLLVSASHHPVSRLQWERLRAGVPGCLAGADPAALARPQDDTPLCLDLCAPGQLAPAAAAARLAQDARCIAQHLPRPRLLVVVGGDTLLALCHALGTHSLLSAPAQPRAGWGSAQLLGGVWDGLVCHTRSGAFGGPDDLQQVVRLLA